MKHLPKSPLSAKGKQGFTLIELMVAMAITTIIVTVLVSITSIALDTWNRSRSEVRAARQAKAMTDTMARDLEALVTRRGNNFQWLVADGSNAPTGGNLPSTNAGELTFFTSATDRYEGQINTSSDKGGDVSCVSYRLEYKDPITGGTSGFPTFVLNRLLVNPDETFKDLLGQSDLKSAFRSYSSKLSEPENFVCENVYQFTTTFHVEVVRSGRRETVPLTLGSSNTGQMVRDFSIDGNGLGVSSDELKGGRVSAVEISLTVLSDFAVEQMRNRRFANPTAQADFLVQHSYQYSKVVEVPGM